MSLSKEAKNMIADFHKSVEAVNEKVSQRIATGELKDDTIGAQKQKWISEAGVYELICTVKEIKDGRAQLECVTDSGEKTTITQFLLSQGAPSPFNYYNLFKGMGIAGGLIPSDVRMREVGYAKMNAILETIKGTPFRASVTLSWRKGTWHILYVSKGVFKAANEKGEIFTMEGYEVEAPSREEMTNLVVSQGGKVVGYLEGKLGDNIIPIMLESEEEAPKVVAKPFGIPKIPTPTPTPTPTPVASPAEDAVPF